jgi:hypothetical protein
MITTSVAQLSLPSDHQENLGFYLWNGDENKIAKKAKEKAKNLERAVIRSGGFITPKDRQLDMAGAEAETDMQTWMEDYSKVIDFMNVQGYGVKPGRYERPENDLLCRFETRLLVNLEPETDLKRESEKSKWNNVIPFSRHDKKEYARRYCVGTGRQNVLYPVKDRPFGGGPDFNKIVTVSPTEQIFFSLYLLVKKDNQWIDMITKEIVKEDQKKKIIQIENLGFVKIVLLYELSSKGASQLRECYVDGLEVPVAFG